MINYSNDKRVVLTLDAGGTNFVFSAIKGNVEITTSITLPSNANNLDFCLETIIKGFKEIIIQINDKPVAISFAFPGPADYENGIIGDLGNLPGFRGGVALGPMLKEIFGIPVFINNDGDLFTYGEAIAGFLPFVNHKLKLANSNKRFKNLLGVTLGTGFGAGIVRNNEVFLGDNGAGAEIWLMRNKLHPFSLAEEGVSIRAIKRVYQQNSNFNHDEDLSPKDIFDIATGIKPGDKQAALKSFEEMGEILGDALSNAITLIDGLIVIGGGLSGAASLFLPKVIEEMNGHIKSLNGKDFNRLEVKVFDLEDETQFAEFAIGEQKIINVPKSNNTISYDPLKRIGIGLSKLGTSKAIAIGAYSYALHQIDTKVKA